jgi:two-component system phosphate regulon response regulator OmpR
MPERKALDGDEKMAATWNLKKLLVDVRDTVRDRSRRLPTKGDDVIEVGDFRIDISGRTVTLRGRELQLNAAEFEVLVFLASHPKRLVTPRTMLATSWTRQKAQQTEFLRALVSLGKKLRAEEGSTQRYLKTEPWIFYSFDPGPLATAAVRR